MTLKNVEKATDDLIEGSTGWGSTEKVVKIL
jgi:hypothetical protein